MKNSILKSIAILLITTMITSCGVDMLNKVSGNRNVIKKERKTSNKFTGITVSNGLELYITQGAKNKVIVEADENLHEIIITEVENDILNIYTEKNIGKSKSKKVYVTIKNLTSLKASSGGYVSGEEVIKTDTITIGASSGANVKILLDAVSVGTSSSSGSSIKIAGTTSSHSSRASSGASINAYNLESKSVIAKASSGASIDIYASENLDGKASSGASIDVKGSPKVVHKKTSSGGSVRLN